MSTNPVQPEILLSSLDKCLIRKFRVVLGLTGIIVSLIMMSTYFGIIPDRVAAEGVETEEQGCFLQNEQCKQFQGLFFSRPLPASELYEQFLRLKKQV